MTGMGIPMNGAPRMRAAEAHAEQTSAQNAQEPAGESPPEAPSGPLLPRAPGAGEHPHYGDTAFGADLGVELHGEPLVAQEQWLPQPEYWLSDHQRIPRPKTQPIPRPVRFNRAPRWKSAVLMLVVVVAVGAAIAGGIQLSRAGSNLLNELTAPAPKAQPGTRPQAPVTSPAQTSPAQQP